MIFLLLLNLMNLSLDSNYKGITTILEWSESPTDINAINKALLVIDKIEGICVEKKKDLSEKLLIQKDYEIHTDCHIWNKILEILRLRFSLNECDSGCYISHVQFKNKINTILYDIINKYSYININEILLRIKKIVDEIENQNNN
ncbi:hypothetical protein H312_01800 [Anncaliia algerae PRA339]|uniref:Uncharacterized protein n=1 Tax=Anncaliia algerae PRA339 TaxID=1288291 RepID=A0A059F0G3_9MICR|nr:hypothetical protein H312_01800 [Anncaliia algerae PRA339]